MYPAAVKIMLSINSAQKVESDLHAWDTTLLGTIFPLSFYVLHYGGQYFSGLNRKKCVPNKSSVQLDFLSLPVEIYFKYIKS